MGWLSKDEYEVLRDRFDGDVDLRQLDRAFKWDIAKSCRKVDEMTTRSLAAVGLPLTSGGKQTIFNCVAATFIGQAINQFLISYRDADRFLKQQAANGTFTEPNMRQSIELPRSVRQNVQTLRAEADSVIVKAWLAARHCDDFEVRLLNAYLMERARVINAELDGLVKQLHVQCGVLMPIPDECCQPWSWHIKR